MKTGGTEFMTTDETLAATYRDMYEERARTNPAAFTLGNWKDHFATLTALQSLPRAGRILDLGCGTGEIDIWIARIKPDVAIDGVDICQEAVAVAAAHAAQEQPEVARRLAFHVSVIERLPFPSHSFDGCLISHTLEHIRDHRAIFKELHRVLKPGAEVVIVVPFRHNFDDPTHVWHFSVEQLRYHLSLLATDVRVWTSEDGLQLAASCKPSAHQGLPQPVTQPPRQGEEALLARLAAKVEPGCPAVAHGTAAGLEPLRSGPAAGKWRGLLLPRSLERMRYPWVTLPQFAEALEEGATVVAAVRNARFLPFLHGIVCNGAVPADPSSLRFFTRQDLLMLFGYAGIVCSAVEYAGDSLPQEGSGRTAFKDLAVTARNNEEAMELRAEEIVATGRKIGIACRDRYVEYLDRCDLLASQADQLQKEEPAKAMSVLKHLLDRYPNHVPSMVILAGMYLDTGDMEHAAELLERIIALSPGATRFMKDLAAIRFETGNREAATDLYRMVVEADPGDHNAMIAAGNLEYMAGRRDAAAALFRKVVAADPANATARENLRLLGVTA